MAPKRQVADFLTDDESAIMLIATRLYAGLRRWEEQGEKVNVEWYQSCINHELVRNRNSLFT
jgi:hypothetical protein